MSRITACLLVAMTLTTIAPFAPLRADDDDLEKQLLGDLESELLNDLEDAKKKPKDAKTKKGEPLRQAGDGEDIPLAEQDPLAKIAQQMRRVEQLISGADTSEETQKKQRQIVDDLAVMIKQLNKQKQQQPSKGKGGQKSSKKPAPGSSAGKANKPASESSDRLGKSDRSKVDEEALKQLIKEVWGHLPERIRDRIQTPTVDKFLPKYEKLIEDYFRRLAEEDR